MNIQGIKDTIVKAVSPSRIILFGSRATGAATEESDVDLVVIWDSPDDPHQRNVRIRRLFPRRDFSLDVFVYTSAEAERYKDVKGTILHTAFTKGKLLYERR
jgi:predicted nucleotidyltransferase